MTAVVGYRGRCSAYRKEGEAAMAWSPGMGSLSEYCFPFLILYLNKDIEELKHLQTRGAWLAREFFLLE